MHGVTEGGEAGGLHCSRLEEEGADSCRGEGKLTAGAVGVTGEGDATLAAAGVPVAEEEILQRREREKWCNCHVRWFYGYWRWG